jgi:site-specific DNA-methyltransferase (adenine-specific)
MADHSWLVCWFGPEPWFNVVYELLLAAGFNVTRMCGIWTKPTGQTNQPAIYLANSYEMFFYARKGKAALARQGRINTFDTSPVSSKFKTHPTERPVELMQDILTTFAWEGSRVMVPFLGSGNTLIAAHLAKMTGFGFELGKEYKDSFVLKVNEL